MFLSKNSGTWLMTVKLVKGTNNFVKEIGWRIRTPKWQLQKIFGRYFEFFSYDGLHIQVKVFMKGFLFTG